MLVHEFAVLADDDVIMNLDRVSRRLALHAVFVVIKPREQLLLDRRPQRLAAVERTTIGNQRRSVARLEHLSDGANLELKRIARRHARRSDTLARRSSPHSF